MSQRSSYSSHTKMPIFTHIRKWKFFAREVFLILLFFFLWLCRMSPRLLPIGEFKCMNDNSSGKLKISLTLSVDVAGEMDWGEENLFW